MQVCDKHEKCVVVWDDAKASKYDLNPVCPVCAQIGFLKAQLNVKREISEWEKAIATRKEQA